MSRGPLWSNRSLGPVTTLAPCMKGGLRKQDPCGLIRQDKNSGEDTQAGRDTHSKV